MTKVQTADDVIETPVFGWSNLRFGCRYQVSYAGQTFVGALIDAWGRNAAQQLKAKSGGFAPNGAEWADFQIVAGDVRHPVHGQPIPVGEIFHLFVRHATFHEIAP